MKNLNIKENSFVQFNQKIGFKFDDFKTSAGVFVDIEINGVYSGNIFFTSSSSVDTGACVYLERNGVCYWAKVKSGQYGAYLINFTTNFSGECE